MLGRRPVTTCSARPAWFESFTSERRSALAGVCERVVHTVALFVPPPASAGNVHPELPASNVPFWNEPSGSAGPLPVTVMPLLATTAWLFDVAVTRTDPGSGRDVLDEKWSATVKGSATGRPATASTSGTSATGRCHTRT